MNHVVLLKARSRKGLVPVKRLVQKQGKPYMQTFYVRPDQVPKGPDKPKMIAAPDTKLLPAPAPQWKGPFKDERVYMFTDSGAVRIPEDAIDSRVVRAGQSFVVHRSYSHISEKFMSDEWTVTEVTTGLRVAQGMTAEQAKGHLDEFVERFTEDRIKERIDTASKLADLPSEKFDESYKPTIQPDTPATEDDYRNLAEHIYETVMGNGRLDPDDEYEMDKVAEIIQWAKDAGGLDTQNEIDEALTDLDEDDWFKVELAVRFGLDLDDADAIADDLGKVISMGDQYHDEVMGWYERHYDGAQFDINLNYVGTYSDYGNEWTESMVVDYAIENDVSLETAQAVAEEATEEDDQESMREYELQDVYDSQGNLWTTDELETMVRWMGGDVSGPRNHGREADRSLREGDTPQVYDDIANLFMTKSVEVPYKTLYRGTPNPVWARIQPGERYECGFASFSKEEEFAGAFHRAKYNEEGYDRFIVICEAPEGESLMGIDIHDIGQNLVDDGINNETFEAYERENEVTLRAPALEVTRTEDETQGVLKTRYVYVKPADMELVEMLKSQFSDLNELVFQSFNEPLGKPRGNYDESDSVPTPES